MKPPPLHADPGLQPERTVMSWGRTLLALFVVSIMFLRWYPTVGLATLLPAVVCGASGLAVHFSQRYRYSVQAAGIAGERVRADAGATVWLVLLVCLLSALGIGAIWWQ